MIKEVDAYLRTLNENFVIDDWEGVILFLAAVAAHWVPGNMLWFRIIGASGSGKSELLRSLEYNIDDVVSADSFTPGAIRGGYVKDTPRMLELWNRKIVVTKDFASMITKKKEDKSETFGLLRSAWDGTLSAFYGSDDSHVKLNFNFDWIVASTPHIERQRSLEAELGSRFVDMKWRTPVDENAAILSAMNGDSSSASVREKLGKELLDIVASVKKTDIPTSEIPEWLPQMAGIAAKLRTPVYRDAKHEIYDIPTPEIGTRLGQNMQRITKGLSLIGVDEDKHKSYVRRLALDCLSNLRRIIVANAIEDPTKDAITIAKEANVSTETVRIEVENLKMLGWGKDFYESLRP